MLTESHLAVAMAKVSARWTFFDCTAHVDRRLEKVVSSRDKICVDTLLGSQRATLAMKKALRALKRGLTSWKTSASAAKPKAKCRKSGAAVPSASQKKVLCPRPAELAVVSLKAAKSAAKPRKARPAKPAPGPSGSDASVDSTDDGERAAVIGYSSDESGSGDELKSDWRDVSAAADRKRARDEDIMEDKRRDPATGCVHLAHRALPVGRVVYKREATRSATAHVHCTLHKSCSKWVTLEHLPARKSLVEWLALGEDCADAVAHMKLFYPTTHYRR